VPDGGTAFVCAKSGAASMSAKPATPNLSSSAMTFASSLFDFTRRFRHRCFRARLFLRVIALRGEF
jgi:hypothetical protein